MGHTMTTKELSYVDDALGHAQFLTTQFETASSQLTDASLKQFTKQWADQFRQMYSRFYNLV